MKEKSLFILFSNNVLQKNQITDRKVLVKKKSRSIRVFYNKSYYAVGTKRKKKFLAGFFLAKSVKKKKKLS